MSDDRWAFAALGTPAPQGSKRHVGRGVMVESSKALAPWRDTVTAAALGAGPCLDGPLVVRMVFTLPRPKSAPKKDTWPYRLPDLSKLARGVEDSITAAGLWADDARIVQYQRLAKVWTDHDREALPVPGVVVGCSTAAGCSTWPGTDEFANSYVAALRGVWRRYEGITA